MLSTEKQTRFEEKDGITAWENWRDKTDEYAMEIRKDACPIGRRILESTASATRLDNFELESLHCKKCAEVFERAEEQAFKDLSEIEQKIIALLKDASSPGKEVAVFV